MPVIAVIGANGQVGSEVCLYLNQMPGVQVVPICRSRYASSFLRKCGLECTHGELDPAKPSELLRGCDLVADFSLPKGSPSVVRAAIHKTLTGAIKASDTDARVVYISSMMAFGMGTHSKVMRNYSVARTRYGSTKRFGERLLFKLTKTHSREGYVLRLGQVHGELQMTTRAIKRELKNQTAYVPKGPSYTVFAFTIAEALCRIAEGKERPGLYTLVSEPAWSWREIHEYYFRQASIEADIVEYDNDRYLKSSITRKALSLITQPARTAALQFLERHRETISSSFSHFLPETEQKMAADRLTRKAASEISALVEYDRYQPYEPFQGVVPGLRLTSITDSRLTMEPVASKVREVIRNVTHREPLLFDRAETMSATVESVR